MRKFSIYLFILITWTNVTNATNQSFQKVRYQLKDLEALENDKEYIEFFSHAKDIIPSKRTKIWKDMVTSMGIEMLGQMKSLDKALTPKNYQFILEISQWPALKNNEFFIKQRDEVLTNHYLHCFKNSDYQTCHKSVLDFINKHPTSTEFSFNLIGKISSTVPANQKHLLYLDDLGLWPIINKFVKTEFSEFYCNQTPLKETIEKKLFSMAYKNNDFIITGLIHKDCWKVIKNSFKTSLLTSNDPYLRFQTYSLIEKNMELAKKDVYTFTLLQLLSGIKLDPDQVITYWRRLKEISQNYLIRNEIFEKFKNRIPLPGEVFLGATKQQRHISKALSQYFPEYIDYYSTTCIEHLQGLKETQGGNPAIRCHELFELSDSLKILPKGKQIQYSQIMKY